MLLTFLPAQTRNAPMFKMRGDLAISAQADALTVYDNINCLYRSDFILDIKTVSVVNGVDSRV